jgi:hypothetical protein
MIVELEPGNYRTSDGDYAITNPSIRDWFKGRLAALPPNCWSVIDVTRYLEEGDRVRSWSGKGTQRDRPTAYVLGSFGSLADAKAYVLGLY